jgi:hypothetical protein
MKPRNLRRSCEAAGQASRTVAACERTPCDSGVPRSHPECDPPRSLTSGPESGIGGPFWAARSGGPSFAWTGRRRDGRAVTTVEDGIRRYLRRPLAEVRPSRTRADLNELVPAKVRRALSRKCSSPSATRSSHCKPQSLWPCRFGRCSTDRRAQSATYLRSFRRDPTQAAPAGVGLGDRPALRCNLPSSSRRLTPRMQTVAANAMQLGHHG